MMGTTGGDRTKLIDTVKKAGTYAVIAPQMGKQVSALPMILMLGSSTLHVYEPRG